MLGCGAAGWSPAAGRRADRAGSRLESGRERARLARERERERGSRLTRAGWGGPDVATAARPVATVPRGPVLHRAGQLSVMHPAGRASVMHASVIALGPKPPAIRNAPDGPAHL